MNRRTTGPHIASNASSTRGRSVISNIKPTCRPTTSPAQFT